MFLYPSITQKCVIKRGSICVYIIYDIVYRYSANLFKDNA